MNHSVKILPNATLDKEHSTKKKKKKPLAKTSLSSVFYAEYFLIGSRQRTSLPSTQ
jgi:hypothetical protein